MYIYLGKSSQKVPRRCQKPSINRKRQNHDKNKNTWINIIDKYKNSKGAR